MCAIFGLLDYKGKLSSSQRRQIIRELGKAAEVRGTDATGIAFFHEGKLHIQKAPRPARRMKYRIPEEARYIMGHTRMTIQGSARRNQNNHPFAGKAGDSRFDDSNLIASWRWYSPMWKHVDHQEDEYLSMVMAMGEQLGISRQELGLLSRAGYSAWDMEDLLYDDTLRACCLADARAELAAW